MSITRDEDLHGRTIELRCTALTRNVRVDNVGKVLADDFFRSCAATGVEQGAAHSLESVRAWLSELRRTASMRVRRIPFSELRAWRFSREGLLRLEHATGRFFTVEGARFTARGTGRQWEQPVLNQPEVGLLGFLSADIGGLPHLLVQAKWEPGNAEMQLSPTVQATHSNYTRVHGGRVQPYIKHFASPAEGDVLFDALMPEHGRFFLRKFNRNVVVRVDPHIDVLDNFRWVTVGQLKALLRSDGVVHMDTRSVIACLPLGDEAEVEDVSTWLAGEDVQIEARPLDGLAGWAIDGDAIHPVGLERASFSIIAVHVEAGAREVAEWTQPMIEPSEPGYAGVLCARMDGAAVFLVEGRSDPGYAGAAQVFPTVSSESKNDVLDAYFRNVAPEWVRFSAQNSEEGGRFFRYENRQRVVEMPPGVRLTAPHTHRWLTLGQISRLARQGRVSMELRNLLACVPVA